MNKREHKQKYCGNHRKTATKSGNTKTLPWPFTEDSSTYSYFCAFWENNLTLLAFKGQTSQMGKVFTSNNFIYFQVEG